jgi:hypothetical protein
MTEKAPKKPLPDHDIATRIMERMVRMPPKPHSEMKLSKRKASWPPGPPFIELFEELRLLLEQPGVPRSAAFAVSSWMPFKYNPDASLDLYFQNESPCADMEANWLPAPKGPFNLTMRLYAPKRDALTGEWNPPPVKKINLSGSGGAE